MGQSIDLACVTCVVGTQVGLSMFQGRACEFNIRMDSACLTGNPIIEASGGLEDSQHERRSITERTVS